MKPPPVTVYLPSPHVVNRQFELITWCEDHFGKRWGLWNKEGKWCCFVELKKSRYRWHFASERDATMFLLRWA